jgi:integrase
MTNPRVVASTRRLEDGTLVETLNEEATAQRKNRPPLMDSEVETMLANADTIEKLYFQLRAKCVVSIAVIFGKRRSEIAALGMTDLLIEGGYLKITFTLRKKHKFGLHQYLKFLEKNDPENLATKTIDQIKAEWREWQKTEKGFKYKENRTTKKVLLGSAYVQHIIDYWNFVKRHYPKAEFLFPSSKNVFGNLIVNCDKHVEGQTLLLEVKKLDQNTWMHLFRERKGGSIAKKLGMSITAIYEVKNTLDIEEQTAFSYLRRFGEQEITVDKT